MTRFKVGDKVKTIIGIGVIVQVDEVDEAEPYQIKYGDGKCLWRCSNLAKLVKNNSRGFQECFDCAQKIGSTTLCEQCLWVRDNYKPKPKFKVGDEAIKPKGYKFDCTIVSVFKTVAGETRLVGENGDGLLHIFNESNLEYEF